MPTLTEISIGALSRRTGVAVFALRYYETLGFISSNRNRGGQRRFLRSDIRRVSLSKQHKLLDFLCPA
ncbi:MAG: MerR family DNA-binding transcriptional regulator [Rhodobacteraceae bacterium]|nr:MerR family DNA-binding transcriptional regulator [Paracoccaceae bacterium]